MLIADAEPERPYERPPLSKDYLMGKSGREKIYADSDRIKDAFAGSSPGGRDRRGLDRVAAPAWCQSWPRRIRPRR